MWFRRATPRMRAVGAKQTTVFVLPERYNFQRLKLRECGYKRAESREQRESETRGVVVVVVVYVCEGAGCHTSSQAPDAIAWDQAQLAPVLQEDVACVGGRRGVAHTRQERG